MSSDSEPLPAVRPPAAQEDRASPPSSAEVINVRALPKEVGVMLLSAGVVGFVMPGPGTPAIIAGGLVLWPQGFGKVEGWFQQQFPQLHRAGMKHLHRYLQDLNRRYPWSNGGDGAGDPSR